MAVFRQTFPSRPPSLPPGIYSLCLISVTVELEALAEEKGDSSAGQWAGEPLLSTGFVWGRKDLILVFFFF